MPIYRTSGQLVHAIADPDDIILAQKYLTSDDMTQYLDPELQELIEHIEWKLEADGLNWSVTAFARRPIDRPLLKELSSWVSGQNSDGLGEGFEQQEFAEFSTGGSYYDDEDDEGDDEEWHMCSFDWQTNNCVFEQVK